MALRRYRVRRVRERVLVARGELVLLDWRIGVTLVLGVAVALLVKHKRFMVLFFMPHKLLVVGASNVLAEFELEDWLVLALDAVLEIQAGVNLTKSFRM